MVDQSLLKAIRSCDWRSFEGPELYEPSEVVPALESLFHLEKEEDIDKTYNRVLWAIGNNHAGTYYPAIRGALEFLLIAALDSESRFSRECAANILFDLYSCFIPEVGSSQDITDIALESFVVRTINSRRKDFERIVQDGGADTVIADLLDCMEGVAELTVDHTGT